jgi:hypothetical protein
MDVHLTSSGDNISRAGVSELEDLRGACFVYPEYMLYPFRYLVAD